MKTIWKYELWPGKEELQIPKGGEVLCVKMQNGVPCLWVLVESEREVEEIRVSIYGTGFEVKENPGKYAGTFITEGFVFHVFVRRKE